MPPTYEFESELQEAIVRALEACGCWPMVNRVVKHRRAPTGLGTGSPDLLVAIPTHGLLFVECKRDAASKPSPEQIRWHARARTFGVRSVVVRSATEVLACVQAIRGGRAWPVTPVATDAASGSPSPPQARQRPRGRTSSCSAAPARPDGRSGRQATVSELTHGTKGKVA